MKENWIIGMTVETDRDGHTINIETILGEVLAHSEAEAIGMATQLHRKLVPQYKLLGVKVKKQGDIVTDVNTATMSK